MSLIEQAKRILRAFLPRSITDPFIRRFFRVRWTGNYAGWNEARADSNGYDAPAILTRVRRATALVRDGVRAFERDGVTFTTPRTNDALLACLRRASVAHPERLDVLDFGGSLGSTYWQHRRQFGGLGHVSWRVVEQPAFVEIGRREFSNDSLQFYSSFEAACREAEPHVVLFASVLPYVEEPHAVVEQCVSRGVERVVIARTGLVRGSADRLTVQHVPRAIYGATYPCWFLSRERLFAHFRANYNLVHEERTPDGHDSGFEFWNLVFERRTQ